MPFPQRIGIFFLPILLCLSSATVCVAADVETLRTDVEKMCSESFAGRKTGTDGAGFCSDYLAWRFLKMGYEPEIDPFRLDGVDAYGKNVIATLPGMIDSQNWIVIAAHFDGLGVMDGSFYPGADSNASAVAALLAIAEDFRPLQHTGIVFAALDGATNGYSGAKELQKWLSGCRIKIFVCLDIIGSDLVPVRENRPNYLLALGGRPYMRQIEEAALKVSGKLGPMYVYYDYYGSADFTNLFYRRVGDQVPFVNAGVPSVVFTSGITYNVNRISDTPPTLNYQMLLDRVMLISAFLRH